MKSGFIDAGRAQIGYDIAGTGDAVVLIHAGIADRSMWDVQMAALASSFRAIRYDLRGFGGSSLPAERFSNHDDLRALLDRLEIERASVVGSSMGAGVALDFAIAHPGRVSSLVLVGAILGGRDTSPVVSESWSETAELMEAGDLDGANELELKMWIDGIGRDPLTVDPAFREAVRVMNRRQLERQMGADLTGVEELELQPLAHDRLGEVRAPSLIVVGAHDVPDVLDSAQLFIAGIPHAELATIQDASHLPNMERPAEFNTAVLEFMSRTAFDRIRRKRTAPGSDIKSETVGAGDA